jgi:hypothetical protein
VLDYLSRFDLGCIGETVDRRLIAIKNPVGCLRAWWCQGADVGMVLARARADHGDVEAAAAALRIKLADHASVMQRTSEVVRRLDGRVRTAQEAGDLKIFNRSYRKYRLDLTAAGRTPMTYTVARSRLRQAIAEVASGKAAPGIIARVFDDRRPHPQQALAAAPAARQTGRVAQCPLADANSCL